MPTQEELYATIRQRLEAVDPDAGALEARFILKDVMSLSDAELITQSGEAVPTGHQAQILNIVSKREAGEPLSRIMGQTEFWGLPFTVTPDVLDPRADTEILIEAALKWVAEHGRENDPLRILDLGTGSGCIPIALLSELPNATAIAVDYSYDAALIASRNAEQNKVCDRFMVIQSDWLTALQPQSFDLIVSNPPYIPSSDIANLSVEVKNHDPILALSGGIDGMDCYKKIIFSLESHLKDDAHAFLEIGFDQLSDLMRLVDDSTLRLCDSVADYGGIPRVVDICRGDK